MREFDFLTNDKTSFDLSCADLKPILLYIEKTYNRDILIQFVTETGLDINYLENEDNWISFNYFNLFLEKLVTFTDNPRAPYEAGIYILSKESSSILSYFFNVLKLFSTPKMAYSKMIKYRSLISNIDTMNILSWGKNKIKIRYKLFNKYKPTIFNCAAKKGQFAAIPNLWNLPCAKVKELQCQTQGADSCIYEISWNTHYYAKIIYLISLIFQKIKHGYSKKNLLEKRSKALEMAIYNRKNEYHQLQKTNRQLIEKANKLSIINRISEEFIKTNNESNLFKYVLKIIIDNMDFDIGFVLFLDKNFRCIKKPLEYNKMAGGKELIFTVSELFNIEYIKKLFIQGKTQIIMSDLLFNNVQSKEVLVVPIQIQKKSNYIMALYNYEPYKKIDTHNLDFFITISRQLEIALENLFASQAAKNIISSLPSSIIIFNRKTLNISYINPNYLNNIGISSKKGLGENIFNFLKIKDTSLQSYFCSQIKTLSKKNYIDNQELYIDNKVIGYTLFKMPEIFGSGSEIGMVMKNITEQKEIKEQLFRAEKLAALGTMVSGIAHEINNPLYGVLGTAEIIYDEIANKKIKEFAKEIIDFTVQASDIVKNLSSYSRDIREDKATNININQIMDEALHIVKYSKNFIDISIKKNYKDIPTLFARSGELRQIYLNLYNNAIQAMEGKGILTLTTRFTKGHIETKVEDNGKGIPKAILPKIFDPFFTTKQVGKGTGLGLNIVYRLVSQNNGVISVQSKQDKGTTFTIKYFIKNKDV